MAVELRNKFKVLARLKKTTARFWRDVKEGDEFELRYTLSGGNGYAPEVEVWQDNVPILTDSAINLGKNLDKFEIEKIQ